MHTHCFKTLVTIIGSVLIALSGNGEAAEGDYGNLVPVIWRVMITTMLGIAAP